MGAKLFAILVATLLPLVMAITPTSPTKGKAGATSTLSDGNKLEIRGF